MGVDAGWRASIESEGRKEDGSSISGSESDTSSIRGFDMTLWNPAQIRARLVEDEREDRSQKSCWREVGHNPAKHVRSLVAESGEAVM